MRASKGVLGGAVIFSFVLSLAGPMSAFAAGPEAIDLFSADHFAILAKSGISTTGSTSIVGDIGVSPSAATSITGFALTLPVGGASATSSLVDGNVYAPGYADPTPADMTTAVSDMETAYTDGTGRTNPTATELGAGNIGGMTLAPGLYKWSTGVTIPSDVTLSGGADDVWIFQVAQTLTVSSSVHVILSGGAQASHIFWVVAGQTTIGTTAVFNGTILDMTAIVLNTGAELNGRALAQTAVTLDANAVTMAAESVDSGSSTSDSGSVDNTSDTSSDSTSGSSDSTSGSSDSSSGSTGSTDDTTSDSSSDSSNMSSDTDIVVTSPTTTSDEEDGITVDDDGHRVSPSTTTTGASPFDQTVESISTVQPGWLIRSKNYGTVYYVGTDNKRHVFWDAQTYFTWSNSWDDVVWVTDATLQTLTTGSPMLAKPGEVLVKIQSDPSVYKVETDATTGDYLLRKITSESIASAMYGEHWADYVVDVEPTLLAHYTRGTDVTSAESIDVSAMETRDHLATLSHE